MIVGIDTGGTNVDGVLLDEGVVATTQVPGDVQDPIKRLLDSLLDGEHAIERVVVVTTLVLNAAVQDRLPSCTNVLVPGPGLDPERAFYGDQNHVAAGCIDTRGRVTEPVAYEGTPTRETVAVTAKFGTRNPEPEKEVRAGIDHPDQLVAFGHTSGPELSFPERAATTVANAKARPTFADFAANVSEALEDAGIDAPAYYLKGDGALLSVDAMRSTPAHALRAGAAASALGLVALSGIHNGVCVDVGGTTTDVIPVSGGFPTVEGVDAADFEIGYDGVKARSLPYGGDSRVLADGLAPRRDGNAAAFGGEEPTLTDALYVVGLVDPPHGDARAAHEAFQRFDDPETVARQTIDAYVDRVTEAITALATGSTELIAGGVLGPHLADRIADESTLIEAVTVPDHAAVAGAVGCAVARVSVQTRIRIDSARGTITVSSVGTRVSDVERGRTFDDDAVERLTVENAREAAREAGAVDDELLPVEVLSRRRFNVVEDADVTGQVVDATAQVTPGLRKHLEGGP